MVYSSQDHVNSDIKRLQCSRDTSWTEHVVRIDRRKHVIYFVSFSHLMHFWQPPGHVQLWVFSFDLQRRNWACRTLRTSCFALCFATFVKLRFRCRWIGTSVWSKCGTLSMISRSCCDRRRECQCAHFKHSLTRGLSANKHRDLPRNLKKQSKNQNFRS